MKKEESMFGVRRNKVIGSILALGYTVVVTPFLWFFHSQGIISLRIALFYSVRFIVGPPI